MPEKQADADEKGADNGAAAKPADVGAAATESAANEDDALLEGDDWGDEGVGPDEVVAGDEAAEAAEGGAAEGGEAGEGEGADAGPPADADAGNKPHPGPCKITWSTGAVLSFKYEEGGGQVRIDEDGNGKVDTCGSFSTADGKTTKVTIDEGCKGKHVIEIVPTYDPKANVATASFTETVDGASKTRDVTLVTMPSFTGLTPGYPIYASRESANVYVRAGLARTADAKAPWQGEPVKATFGYDKAKRLVRVKEDFGGEGGQDRRFDYRYDAAGNVTGMSVVIGSGQTQQKGSARISYSCFDTP